MLRTILVLLKSVAGNIIQPDSRLIWVLDEQVLPILLLHDHVDKSAHDGPAVVEVEGHLVGEVAGLVGEDAKDDVVVVVLGVGAGDETVAC